VGIKALEKKVRDSNGQKQAVRSPKATEQGERRRMRPKGAFGAAQDNLPTGRQASRAAIWRQGEAEIPPSPPGIFCSHFCVDGKSLVKKINMKNKLFVFAGKPGVGKTTIINKIFPDKKIVDVLTFIEVFRINNIVPEEKTIVAYQNMYQYLANIDESEMILEIGTNHPELNIIELSKLSDKYDIRIFLCDADKETCYQRAVERGMRHTKEAFEARMKRDFPNTHIKLISQSTIPYEIVEMSDSLPETIEKFKKIIEKNYR